MLDERRGLLAFAELQATALFLLVLGLLIAFLNF